VRLSPSPDWRAWAREKMEWKHIGRRSIASTAADAGGGRSKGSAHEFSEWAPTRQTYLSSAYRRYGFESQTDGRTTSRLIRRLGDLEFLRVPRAMRAIRSEASSPACRTKDRRIPPAAKDLLIITKGEPSARVVHKARWPLDSHRR